MEDESRLESQLHHSVGADFLLLAHFLAQRLVDEDVHAETLSGRLELVARLVHSGFDTVAQMEICSD